MNPAAGDGCGDAWSPPGLLLSSAHCRSVSSGPPSLLPVLEEPPSILTPWTRPSPRGRFCRRSSRIEGNHYNHKDMIRQNI